MANIGKSLGVVLGPRGKMPRPIPPQADIERIIQPELRNTIYQPTLFVYLIYLFPED